MKKRPVPVTGIVMILGFVLIGLFALVIKLRSQEPDVPPQPNQTVNAGELFNASHVLISHGAKGGGRTKDEALKLALEVFELAKSDPGDFSKLASTYSDCPSKSKGGSLGNFPPEQMVAPFSAAVKEMEIGEISEPVETQFGYHVIQRLKVE